MNVKGPIVVYAESTPNPASMKFVLNNYLLEEGSVEYTSKEQAKECPIAVRLFAFSGVSGVFITTNFITISKSSDTDWYELVPIFREFIKSYIESGQPVFIGAKEKVADPQIEKTHSSSALETKIIETLDEYVKPAVEQDGGAIHFKSFDDGVVTLILKGACSGCPSWAVTLKNGIENLLKQLIPEVKEPVAEAV
jgi:NFU1 iron-sulfur cluster scaffold homolog, mitochondrial